MRQRLCKRTEFLFALADRTLRFDLIGDIDVRAEQTERFPLRIALDHRSGGNPACLAVARPDDTVAYRVLAITAPHRIDELPFGDRDRRDECGEASPHDSRGRLRAEGHVSSNTRATC